MANFDNIGATMKKFGPATEESSVPLSPTIAEAPAAEATEGMSFAERVLRGMSDEAGTSEKVQPSTGLDALIRESELESTSGEDALPVVRQVKETSDSQSDGFTPRDGDSIFTVVGVDSDAMKRFAKEYNPEMKMVRCVANGSMLLRYMVETERAYRVTMPFRAYGVDPIVFEEQLSGGPEDGPQVVEIQEPGKEADPSSKGDLYEQVEVDGNLYLSCVSDCLDADYLHQVIAEATEGVFTHGKYIYTLVGPRPLVSSKEPGETRDFIETLKLNSYELSVLLAYMEAIEGVTVTTGVYGGRSAIEFAR